MMLPPGFCKEEEETRVCKLKKSLYGLKQSPRAWFDRFEKVIKKQGYRQGQSDHTMFFKQSNDGRMTILIVYVDNIILTRDDTGEVERLKKVFAIEFEVKDLGQMRYFLRMEVARSRKGISISQRKYVLDLLTETGMLGCKPSDTPIKARNRMESDGKPVDREKYQRLVGRLIYLSHTRPNIAFAVSVVSQYMHSPKESHLKAAYKILKYLKGSPGRGLFFKKNDITWRSKKQSEVARSSAEVEFRAVALLSIASKIEKLQKDFLWSRVEEGKKDYLIRWDVVCRPKELGGLGFRKTSLRNIALLEKWLRRFPREGMVFGIRFKSFVFVFIRLVFSEIFFLGLVKSLKSYPVPSGQVFVEFKSPLKGLAWVPLRGIVDMMVIAFKGLGNSLRGKTLWQIACLTLLWIVWQERNNWIFEDKGRTKDVLWDLLIFYSSLWAFCTATFSEVPLSVLQLNWTAVYVSKV
ncbi:Retrovirus-related Pol polyprotein from transposon RE1 [Vitis vinifera]|uniref:Retrovirus-related Pol polyprotein from transposon RE1 n=1 Tax=Vitis vinifera TaxID=29760 RepID=A0A438DIZ2_VITVI|nr:Retrovirus-related Pol polyprotein from transposon RE1 [Vitis vinifera]